MNTRPIVFAYDFPHKKTQDVIQRLVAIGCKPRAVIAAPPVLLRVPPPAIRVKARHADLLDPHALCVQLGIPYVVAEHGSAECLHHIEHFEASLGVIAGARILPSAVIEAFAHGIINLHPGLLPHTRGLDAMQWAIYRNQPLGVTAHLVDHRVDAGLLLEARPIDEYPDDALIDVSLRLYETQLDMLGSAIAIATTVSRDALASLHGGSYNRSFPPELVAQMRRNFRIRRARLRRGRASVTTGSMSANRMHQNGDAA